MPAVSKSQQRYFGYLLSNPDERKKEGVTKKVAKEFAGTKHKGLPEKVKEGIDTAILESAWQRKEGKNPSGGLNEKGRKSYERENPGSDLKAPQPEGGSRKKSFCARMGGVKGPMKDEKGRPTRKALALRKWKCSEEYFGLEATLDVQRIRSGYIAEDAPTMSAGSSPAGFSGDAEAEGPVAGLDQPLGGTQKMATGKGVKKTLKYKCKKTKDGVNQMSCPPGVEPFKEAYDPKYLSFRVCIDDGNIEFIYYGKSPADVKIQLRKIYRPEQLKKVKIERLLPGDVMKFYWNKRQAVM